MLRHSDETMFSLEESFIRHSFRYQRTCIVKEEKAMRGSKYGNST
jgi:hypothetical protein